ncbi:MAG: hypothetical protein KDB23_20865 [Planctomycetales bacterium]|nr:hypothetical protein [Planctomycetales bacterium]
MESQNRELIEKELEELRGRVVQLEREMATVTPEHWQASGFYATYYATTGFVLGGIAAVASLLFNVIGSLLVNKHPLQIIQVYLTFPLGEKAMTPEFSTGIGLAIGCCLYIGTGMVLGIIFQMAMARFIPNSNLLTRLAFASVLGLLVWAINFYGILSWLQPALFGGNWIVDPSILPPWVAAMTHLIFAWTMALIYPWGAYVPYRPQTELQ